MYVRAGRLVFARLYVGVYRTTSLTSSCLLLQQCPACLVCLTWIVFVMGGRWPYSWCRVRCCRQDLFNIACKILVQLPSSFFSSRLVSIQIVHPYISIDTTAAWKKLHFILSVRSDFHMIDSLSMNLSTSFREVPSSVEMSPFWLKHINSVLCVLTWRPMPAAVRSKLCSSVSAWLGVLARIAMSSA